MKATAITLLSMAVGVILICRTAPEKSPQTVLTVPPSRTRAAHGLADSGNVRRLNRRDAAPATNQESAYHNRTRALDLMADCDQAIRDREGPLMTKEESRWAMDCAWAAYIHKCHEVMHLSVPEEQPDWMRRGQENHPELEKP